MAGLFLLMLLLSLFEDADDGILCWASAAAAAAAAAARFARFSSFISIGRNRTNPCSATSMLVDESPLLALFCAASTFTSCALNITISGLYARTPSLLLVWLTVSNSSQLLRWPAFDVAHELFDDRPAPLRCILLAAWYASYCEFRGAFNVRVRDDCDAEFKFNVDSALPRPPVELAIRQSNEMN